MKNNRNKIIEGNKLIAEFMGYEYIGYSKDTTPPYGWWKKGTLLRHSNLLQFSLGRKHTDLIYHDSWDSLIPVIHKIGKIDFTEKNGLLDYLTYKFIDESRGCKIDIYSSKMDMFNAVVEFIKWYNNTDDEHIFPTEDDMYLGGNEM